LQSSIQFATRGLIYDRTGKELAWNELSAPTSDASTTKEFASRKYISMPGLSHLLGWVRYPKQDKSGYWWREEYSGMSGLELAYDGLLAGQNGSTMVETDARGKLQRENIVSPPQNGEDLHLSIDADVQSELYQVLSQHAKDMGFVGGAAAIMDVQTGELIALTSFPEYDHQAFTDEDSKTVANASNDPSTPLLNRAISGLYAPGSIVKPIFAAAALNENIISPDKIIVSTGAISIPNPYDPEHPSLFHDWAVHGPIDMRTALAVSSDEYFYTIGGGYGGQKGLGIDRIDKYAKIFGLSQPTGIILLGEQDGVIPTPAWKAETFGTNDPWRIGDTYHTAIGQYGFQITPIQAVRFIAAIANGGKLLTPQLLASSTPQYGTVNIPDKDLQIIREGMRMAVASDRFDATVKALNLGGIQIAAKTGTAQIGTHNQYMNSWSVGFWPADHPKYAYAAVLERAPAGTASGAAPGLVPFFEWLIANRPEYTQ
jgi:penicillin-binding protein 2